MTKSKVYLITPDTERRVLFKFPIPQIGSKVLYNGIDLVVLDVRTHFNENVILIVVENKAKITPLNNR